MSLLALWAYEPTSSPPQPTRLQAPHHSLWAYELPMTAYEPISLQASFWLAKLPTTANHSTGI